ncbi:MAG TPA: hypothetical protein VMV28_06285 [Thermoplasmata archaeon]|nr:hypothetical protein [Thermoplasmata archaeon]
MERAPRGPAPPETAPEGSSDAGSVGAKATTPFAAVHRAYVELLMVRTPPEVVAALERLYLEGWEDAVRESDEREAEEEAARRECEG